MSQAHCQVKSFSFAQSCMSVAFQDLVYAVALVESFEEPADLAVGVVVVNFIRDVKGDDT